MIQRSNCYVTCEVLYHLLGGQKSTWRPYQMRHEGNSHWFLARIGIFGVMEEKDILDPTANQFKAKPTHSQYQKAKRKAFLTKEPSKRAKKLMAKLVWQQ